MKRGILCLVFAAFFALPALAAAEVNGVYIAPRFLVGIQDSGPVSTSVAGGGDLDDGYKQHSQAVFGGALAVGYNFAPQFKLPIRAELEYALRSNSSNKKSGTDEWGTAWETKHIMNISTLFLNAYFDINTGTAFTPYLGAGLGMAFNYTQVKQEFPGIYADSASKHDTTFAWNLGAGVSYAFTENVSADLGYRFISAGYREVTREIGGVEIYKLSSNPYIHEFYLGARFTF